MIRRVLGNDNLTAAVNVLSISRQLKLIDIVATSDELFDIRFNWIGERKTGDVALIRSATRRINDYPN